MKANDRQVGGEHYKSGYQHWDFVTDVNMPYLLAAATKYVTRLGKKEEDDGQKALHFLQKAKERNINWNCNEDRVLQHDFIAANALDMDQEEIVSKVCRGDLHGAYVYLEMVLDQREQGIVPGYVNQDR